MNYKEKYCGVIVPMVTPFTEQFEIDQQGVENIVGGFIRNKCTPFILGTTGESASVSQRKKEDLVRYTVKVVGGRDLVYAGISGNSFDDTVRSSKLYSDLGVDVLVAHLPSYYPIDEDQMLHYYEKLANAVPLPLMLYNIPVTTHLSIPLKVVDKLSHHDNIIGFKDSQRGEERLDESLRLWKDRSDFTFHLGWAAMSSYGLLNGLDGIVPSSGNLVPKLYRGIYDAAKNGDAEEAERLQKITNEISAYYQGGNILSRAFPIFKAMLNAFGLCEPYTALPMITLTADEIQRIKKEAIEQFGIYKN
ncbi:MAG: dihydrodipicolinate synthase family protein [Flavobacteriaceae bacterium]|nr:dihydrodipicolinate synthase family protein [Flavobacteriaceae bacterium]